MNVVQDGFALIIGNNHRINAHSLRLLDQVIQLIKLLKLVNTVEHGLALVVLDVERQVFVFLSWFSFWLLNFQRNLNLTVIYLTVIQSGH